LTTPPKKNIVLVITGFKSRSFVLGAGDKSKIHNNNNNKKKQVSFMARWLF